MFSLFGGSSQDTIKLQTLALSGASAQFTGIPTTYKEFTIRMAGHLSAPNGLTMRFNADAGARYDWQQFYALGASVAGGSNSNSTEFGISYWSNASRCTVDISQYDVGQDKVFTSYGGCFTFQELCGGNWNNTTDYISSIQLIPQGGATFSGGQAILYGVRV